VYREVATITAGGKEGCHDNRWFIGWMSWIQAGVQEGHPWIPVGVQRVRNEYQMEYREVTRDTSWCTTEGVYHEYQLVFMEVAVPSNWLQRGCS
jgi:hypothetical protein